MKLRKMNGGVLWVVAVTVLIAFTSTSLAGEVCDRAFHSVMALSFGPVRPHSFGFLLLHFIAEKGVHLALFAALAMLLSYVMPNERWRTSVILLIAFTSGALSEWLQSFFPGRDPALRDVAINFCGAVFGLILSNFLCRRTLKRSGVLAADSIETLSQQ